MNTKRVIGGVVAAAALTVGGFTAVAGASERQGGERDQKPRCEKPFKGEEHENHIQGNDFDRGEGKDKDKGGDRDRDGRGKGKPCPTTTTVAPTTTMPPPTTAPPTIIVETTTVENTLTVENHDHEHDHTVIPAPVAPVVVQTAKTAG